MNNVFMSPKDAQTLEQFFQQQNDRRVPLEPAEFSHRVGERVYREYTAYRKNGNSGPDSYDSPFNELITTETHYFLSRQGFREEENIFIGMTDEIYLKARNVVLQAFVLNAIQSMSRTISEDRYRLLTSLKDCINLQIRPTQ